jgi:NAD(P)-dependent dehydrogenase (short-subunit alcohol dehydrogenase family)
MNKNKVAIITGGSKGIGLSCASRLAKEGYDIAICSRSIKELKKASHFLKTKYKINCFYMAIDASKDSQVKNFVIDVLKKFKSIDVLINNCGIQLNKKFEKLSFKELQKVIDINLFSYIYFSKIVGQHMIKKKKGKIINISSVLSKFPLSGRLPYSIAKAGVDALTRSLALEWSKYNIACNSINPGHIYTDLIKKDIKKGLISINELKNRSITNKLGSLDDVSNFVFFLIKHGSIYQTGQSYFVDGGFSIKK